MESSSRRIGRGGGRAGGGRSRGKRSREPETVEEAWRIHCKYSVARSRWAARKYDANNMPPKLRDFAFGGRYHTEDPPRRLMPESFRQRWEMECAWKASWDARYAPPWEAGEGSSSGGGAPPTGDEEGEEEDPLFLEAVAASKKDAADKAEAERKDAAHAVALVDEYKAREAEAEREAAWRNYGGVIILE